MKFDTIDKLKRDITFDEFVNLFKKCKNLLNASDKKDLLLSFVKNQKFKEINILIQNNFDLNITDKSNRSLLMHSCLTSGNDIFDLLIEKNNIHHNDKLMNTALHYAVKFYGMKNLTQNMYKVEKLIDYGADINQRNFFNQTPLIFACIYNNVEIVELLCKKGADTNICNGWGDFTPLMFCARMNNLEVLKILIEKGADTNLKNRIFDYSAKDIAKVFGFEEIVNILN